MPDRRGIELPDDPSEAVEPAVKESMRVLAGGTARLTLASGAVLVFQALYFVLVARALGVVAFGALAAALALVAILVPFATWGAGNMLVMEVARDPRKFSVSFGNALVAMVVSGVVLLGVALLAGGFLLPDIPLTAIFFLAVADLGFARLVEIARSASSHSTAWLPSRWLSVALAVGRCAVAVRIRRPRGRRTTWSRGRALYLAATVLAGAVAVWSAVRLLGRPDPDARRRPSTASPRWLLRSLGKCDNDLQRHRQATLARLATLEATGDLRGGVPRREHGIRAVHGAAQGHVSELLPGWQGRHPGLECVRAPTLRSSGDLRGPGGLAISRSLRSRRSCSVTSTRTLSRRCAGSHRCLSLSPSATSRGRLDRRRCPGRQDGPAGGRRRFQHRPECSAHPDLYLARGRVGDTRDVRTPRRLHVARERASAARPVLPDALAR